MGDECEYKTECKKAMGISLREYFETRIALLEKATNLAAATLEKRLESMNEFRAQLKDQSATFITRVEYDANYKKIEDDVRQLRESKSMLEGKASTTSVYMAYLFSIVSIVLAIIGLILREF